MNANDLIAFEREVATAFEAGRIRSPVHLSGGNEEQLLDIFSRIPRTAWVFSTWRSHYHALLHGVPPDLVMAQINAGRSMNLNFPEYRFMSSAIVSGCLPIACGIASQGAECWVFVGDMAASTGVFKDAQRYALGHDLPVHFVIEDNGLSTNSPTAEVWGNGSNGGFTHRYAYKRTQHHVGTGRYVSF